MQVTIPQETLDQMRHDIERGAARLALLERAVAFLVERLPNDEGKAQLLGSLEQIHHFYDKAHFGPMGIDLHVTLNPPLYGGTEPAKPATP